jgi:ankyrin repeat protein
MRVTIGGAERELGSAQDRWLIRAIHLEARDLIPVLLAHGANPNARDPDSTQLTAVALAAEFNDAASLKMLLAAGGDPNIQLTNEYGQTVTPLHRALRRDSIEAVRLLLERGATVLPPDASGWSTMHVAAYEGAATSIPLLVKSGGAVNERTPVPPRQTPLMTAIQHADAATVRALLDAGADPTAKDDAGKDACAWATAFKREPDVAALVCPT